LQPALEEGTQQPQGQNGEHPKKAQLHAEVDGNTRPHQDSGGRRTQSNGQEHKGPGRFVLGFLDDVLGSDGFRKYLRGVARRLF